MPYYSTVQKIVSPYDMICTQGRHACFKPQRTLDVSDGSELLCRAGLCGSEVFSFGTTPNDKDLCC